MERLVPDVQPEPRDGVHVGPHRYWLLDARHRLDG
jgi:hypothetical protein